MEQYLLDARKEMSEKIIDFRLLIDTAINSFQFVLPSREVSLAKTSLERSFMYFGLCLKELGNKNPYPDSTNPASKTIESKTQHTGDNWSEKMAALEEQTQIARVKFFRNELEQIIIAVRGDFDLEDSQQLFESNEDLYFSLYILEAFKQLVETKMWFGMELNRIYNIKTNGQDMGNKVLSLPLF